MDIKYIGFGKISNLDHILKKEEPNNVLLVSGRECYLISGAKDRIRKHLPSYVHFNDFNVNPELSDIIKGVELVKEKNCDFVIGVGGGTVMDVAKAIAVLAGNNESPKAYLSKEANLKNKGLKTLMIPTTAGTGSEATHFSVVHVDGEKYSLAHREFMQPDYAIVDPKLTLSLTPKITACTGMNALCQAIESYWSINATEESKRLSKIAIEKIMKNLTTIYAMSQFNSVNDEFYLNCRKEMALAAHDAGRAINITFTTAAHAVSYKISSEFGVPHGHAVALTLPYFFEFNYGVEKDSDCNGDLKVSDVTDRIDELCDIMEVKSPSAAEEKIIRIMNRLGLETRLSEIEGFEKHHIQLLVDGFNNERGKNNPRVVTKTPLKRILTKIY